MRSLLLVLASGAVYASGVSLARAQDLDAIPPTAEVVVTATRTRTRAEDLTTTVSVIGANEIEETDRTSVSESLRGSPGLDVTTFGSPGHSSFVSIRGAAPDQVLVLLDGVEVNTPTVGQFDFANLTTDGIDRIEVLRGSGGTLYGTEAIGGVVNVLTRRGEGPLSIAGSGEAGRAATNREVVNVSGAHGPFAISGTTSYFGTNGFQPVNDEYRNFSTVWRGDADLVPSGTLTTILRYTNSKTGLPNFNVSEGILSPFASDRVDFFLVKGEWEHQPTDAITYRLSTAYNRNYERYSDDEVDAEGEMEPTVIARFENQIIQADGQVDYRWHEIALTTLGLDFKERSADVLKIQGDEEDEQGGEDDDEDLENENFRANRSNVGVYLEQQISLFDDTLRGIGGFRYDHFDEFGDHVTWSGSAGYAIRPTNTRLRVSYAQGFRAPTFEELFEPELGDPDLEAEESWEVDAGFTQELLDGRLRLEPTYFYRSVEDLIEEIADQLPGPINAVPPSAAASNVDAQFQGVELIASGEPLPWLSLSSNYTYLNFAAAEGVLLNRPKHRGSFTARAERKSIIAGGDRATAALQVFAVGRRYSADPYSEPTAFQAASIAGYARVDLALSYELTGRLSPLVVTAAVRNLFNRDYSESIGFPAPPAWFLLGLRYTFTT